jgi:ABC-type nitrate/sulfonate/bicarbonate transport system substrate-binding protein
MVDSMASPQDKPTVRIARNNPVFALPVIVGIEEGLFDQAGPNVQFSATYADRDRVGRWSSAEPGRMEKDLRQRWQ